MELEVKGNWSAYITSKECLPNRIKIFFLLFVQASVEGAQKEKEKGERLLNQWGLTCFGYIVSNRCKRSKINWSNESIRHTHTQTARISTSVTSHKVSHGLLLDKDVAEGTLCIYFLSLAIAKSKVTYKKIA